MTAAYVDTHYARTLPPTPPRPALRGAVEAEVCIVGGERLAAAIAEGDDRWRLFAPFGLVPTFGPLGVAAAQLTYRWHQLRDAVL